MKETKGSLTPLKDIISSLFSASELPFNLDDARIWEVWGEVVGPGIANHAHPSWIKNGRLRVVVSDSIWLQELEFVGETIRDRLNGKLGRKAVDKIEFRLGSV